MSPDTLRPVEVVILDHETPELTLRAAKSALSSVGVDVSVSILDNGCREDHRPWFRGRLGEHARLRRSAENLGFAGGVNSMLRSGQGRRVAVVLLNSDAVLAPDALALLAHELRTKGVAAVAPAVWRIGRGEERLHGFGYRIDWLRGRPTVRYAGLRRAELPREPFDAEWLSGSCLAVRPSALTAVGLLDERYFAYFEETDWCVRARRLGWRLRNCPTAEVRHLGAQSSTCAAKLGWLLRNNVLFMRKLAPRAHLVPFLVYWWLVQLPNLARWCLSADPRGTASAILAAVGWHLTHSVARERLPDAAAVGRRLKERRVTSRATGVAAGAPESTARIPRQ